MKQAFVQARAALDALLADGRAMQAVERGAADLASCLRAGGKVLLCGNGVSACDAAHFAEELTGRYRADRRPLPAIACTDAGHITCTANDFGFDRVFSRWVEALARPDDRLIVLSTSGNSPNIAGAIEAARAAGCGVIALLGKDGGRIRDGADIEVIVPGATSDRIQELHMLILHAWVEAIEIALFGRS